MLSHLQALIADMQQCQFELQCAEEELAQAYAAAEKAVIEEVEAFLSENLATKNGVWIDLPGDLVDQIVEVWAEWRNQQGDSGQAARRLTSYLKYRLLVLLDTTQCDETFTNEPWPDDPMDETPITVSFRRN